jgi:sugar lactone lactonase YvrE
MRTVAAIVAIVVIAGCSSAAPTPTPTGTPQAQPPATASAQPTATATPVPTPTEPPSATPGATPSTGPSPVVTPSPTATTVPSLSPSPSPTIAGTTVEVFAGGGSTPPADGVAALDAALQRPAGVAVGSDGSIWIVDANLGQVMRVDGSGQLADVTGGMLGPEGVAVAPDGTVYAADRGEYQVVKLAAGGGLVSVAGDPTRPGYKGDGGPASKALLFQPLDVATDGGGDVFIADAAGQRIRMIDGQTGIISTVAGNGTGGLLGDGGPATDAEIYGPEAIAVNAAGTRLLIADTTNRRLRQVDLTSGVITTIAGAGDTAVSYDPSLTGLQTPLTRISALTVDAAGNAYFPVFWGDLGTTIMRMDPKGAMTRVAGGGSQGAGASPLDFSLPDVLGLAIEPHTGALLICGSDGRVYQIAGVATPV